MTYRNAQQCMPVEAILFPPPLTLEKKSPKNAAKNRDLVSSIATTPRGKKDKSQSAENIRDLPRYPHTPDVVLADVKPVVAVEVFVGEAEAYYHLTPTLKPRQALRRALAR